MVNFSQEFIENLRNRIPVSTVVGRKVKLQRKSAGQFLGLCPFHKEKTPSFTVNDDKGFYHCFGCGKHGDIISFEQETYHLSFPEAVEKLAEEAGISIPKASKTEEETEKKRISIYQTLELATKFFQDSLYSKNGEQALAYLKRRGLDSEIIARFRLGYAPDDANLLKHYLTANAVEYEILKKAGLIKKSEKGDGDYTYFRNRVIFPITDYRGKVIAFSGRSIGDAMPKYLNSPETEIFSKGDNLYGLSNAIQAIREKNTAIMVEGNVDVITMAKAGLKYTVAPLGTALTEKQIEKLWKYTDEPCLCFDNDKAGHNAMIKAALRVLPILKEGFSLRFIYIDDVKDPDEYIRSKGVESFSNLVKFPLVDVLWNYLTANFRFDTPEKKAKFETEINDLISKITDTKVKAYYKRDFDQRLKKLIYDTSHFYFSKGREKKTITSVTPNHINIQKGHNETRILIAYCLLYPDIACNFIEDYNDFKSYNNTDSEIDGILSSVIDILTVNQNINTSEIEKLLYDKGLSPIYKTVASEIEMLKRKSRRQNKKTEGNEDFTESVDEIENDFRTRIKNYKIFRLNHNIEELKQMIKESDNNEEKGKLWEEYKSLIHEKEKLTNENF